VRSDEEISEELRKASLGLFYMSESDYPFELIRWDGRTEITSEFLRSVASQPTDCPVQETDFEAFLSGRYQNLAQLMESNLSNLKVYKVGRINMPVYVVGRSPEGSWLGISTRVVET